MAWDTLDTQPYCTSAGLVGVSGGGLIASGGASLSSNNNGLAMPFEGKTGGLFCVEALCIAAGPVDAFGVATAATIALAGGQGYGFLGSNGGSGYPGQFGLGYRQDGDINNNRLYLIGQSALVSWGRWGAGDTLYIAMNLSLGLFWFRINGGPWLGLINTGSPTLGTGGIPLSSTGLASGHGNTRFFPAVSLGNGGQYQFNFGQAPFTYPAPSGFTPGWTNTSLRNFGSFLANGVGSFLNGNQVAVSPYVCGIAGNIQRLLGVGCSGGNTEAVGVIYDSDGAGGGPGTLLGFGGTGGGTEVDYTLGSLVATSAPHTYWLGVFYQENGGARSIPVAGGAPNGLYVDTTATYPTPNSHFTVSSVQANHLPMLAEFTAGGGGGGSGGYSFGEII